MRKSILRTEIQELSDDAVIIIYNWLDDMVKLLYPLQKIGYPGKTGVPPFTSPACGRGRHA